MIDRFQIKSVRTAYTICIEPLRNLLAELESVREVDDRACEDVHRVLAEALRARDAEKENS